MNLSEKVINFNSLLRGNETEEELKKLTIYTFKDLNNISSCYIYKSNLTEFPKCIQFFVNLETLDCSSNKLTHIDVSKNVNLVTLDCYNNNLICIDISKNVNLEYLYCSYNNLTSIDVSIDVSKNLNLELLNCDNNSNLPYAGFFYRKQKIAEFRSKMNDYIRLQKLNEILHD